MSAQPVCKAFDGRVLIVDAGLFENAMSAADSAGEGTGGTLGAVG